MNTSSCAVNRQQGHTSNWRCWSVRPVQYKITGKSQSKIAKQPGVRLRRLVFCHLGAAQTFARSMLPLSVAIISDLLTLIPVNLNRAAKPSSVHRASRSSGANRTVSPGNHPEADLKPLPRMETPSRFRGSRELWFYLPVKGETPAIFRGENKWLSCFCLIPREWFSCLSATSRFHKEWWMCCSTVWEAANGAGRYVRQE